MVFLSYSKPDLDYAKKIYRILNDQHIDVWFDEVSLLPGSHWKFEITKAIKNAEYFIALLSQKSVDRRGYVQAEIMKALEILDQIPINQIFMIPARLDDCKVIHPRLQGIQYINLYPDWEISVNRIVKLIKNR